MNFNPPKVSGKDDETGEDLMQRDDDKPESTVSNGVETRYRRYQTMLRRRLNAVSTKTGRHTVQTMSKQRLTSQMGKKGKKSKKKGNGDEGDGENGGKPQKEEALSVVESILSFQMEVKSKTIQAFQEEIIQLKVENELCKEKL
eukprot:sb/3473989/